MRSASQVRILSSAPPLGITVSLIPMHVPPSGVPRARLATLIVSLMLLASGPLGTDQELTEEIQERRWTDSNDGYGPINYTNEHTTATLTSEGRPATLTMPGGHVYNQRLPLVVALHGYSSSGSFNAWWMSLYDSVHENEHLLLTPDGSMNIVGMRYWNATDACCNLFNTEVDDVTFLEGLIDQAVQIYGADPEGVVLMGHSNGAFMSHRMACDRGSIIESIVSLNGATWDDFSNNCPDTGRPNILHVHGTVDSVIQYGGGSMFGGTYPSAPQSTAFWADRSGCDASWTNLGSIDLTNSDGVAETDDLEHLNCADGNRVAHWKINNGIHAPSLNEEEWPSQTLSWSLEDFSRDSDGDGYRDDVDAFIYNPNEWSDADGDKVGDNTDECDNDPTGWIDNDGDGVCVPSDVFPNNPNEWYDFDGDGTGDNSDADDDNDGVADFYDDFPYDTNETVDTDGDGIGDNADTDDDGDGWADTDELNCQSDPMNGTDVPTDTDGDWECDLFDDDDDGDGVPDLDDQFPLDGNEWDDSDSDGYGDNADAFPGDSTEWADSDGDGIGDNSDVYPLDSSEWADSDGDGVGDNSDAFPGDASETLDTDGDGVGDNADAYPYDATLWEEEVARPLLLLGSIVVGLLVLVAYIGRRK